MSEYLKSLKTNPKNPRTITKQAFEELKDKLRRVPQGLDANKIVFKDGVIMAGNQRFKALQELAKEGFTVKDDYFVDATDWTDEQIKEYVITSNVSDGEWNFESLANEWDIDDLNKWGVELPVPIDIDEDDPPPADKKDISSKVGTFYKLGDHVVYCGSFEDDLTPMFNGKKASCAFTDPPYNVDYKGGTSKKLSIANDNMADEKFQEFLDGAMAKIARYIDKGGGVIVWMSGTQLLTLDSALKSAGLKPKNIIIWVKNHFTFGRGDFKIQAENAIYSLNEGEFDRDSNTDEGECETALYSRGGGCWNAPKNMSTAWFFNKPLANREHPTMKPVGLCAKGVLSMANKGGLVFDPFLGSGSTLIACEQTGRTCYGCELDPMYCDVIRKRYWKFITGSEDGWQKGTE